MTDRNKFRSHIRWLRRHFPLSWPISCHLCPPAKIQRVNPHAAHGVCEIFACEPDEHRSERRPHSFRIWISDSLTEEQTIGVLFHEWAHALRAHIFLFGDLNADDSHRALIEDEIWRKWHG